MDSVKKQKIFNDPVYGFLTVPHGILLQLIDHPYLQRLRRIKQLGMTHYVYPGALHTRFHHALGALHLMQQAIEVLRSKSVEISDEESEAVCCAILLHDVGHGPFSHALEHTLLPVHHERISQRVMERLNLEFNGKLTLAIEIYKGKYFKHFLHQLVSSQLDMDRMDYLKRDSFFTGVAEGTIGHDRIIKMLHVVDGELVVEMKGLYSIEKFLLARRLMYWQVYLHKTVLAAEHMLILCLQKAKKMALSGTRFDIQHPLKHFLEQPLSDAGFSEQDLSDFLTLDDVDISAAIKVFAKSEDKVLALLATGLINRKLFRCLLQNNAFSSVKKSEILNSLCDQYGVTKSEAGELLIEGSESNLAYSTGREEIMMLMKDGTVAALSEVTENIFDYKTHTKHFLCFPKLL